MPCCAHKLSWSGAAKPYYRVILSSANAQSSHSVIDLRHTILLSATPTRVWQVLTDPDLLSSWISGFQSYQSVSGVAGQVDAHSSQTIRQGGREMTFEQRTTIADAPTTFENALDHKNMAMTVRYDLRAVEGGTATELTATQQVQLKSFMFKAVKGMIRQQLEKTLPADLKRLVALIEAQ